MKNRTAERILSEEARSKIAAICCDHDDDVQSFLEGVEWIIKRYRERREAWSRDCIPSAKKLLSRMEDLERHLREALNVLISDIVTMTWAGAPRGESEASTEFVDKLFGLYEQARKSATQLREATKKGAPMTIILQDGRRVKHERRTRTDARDNTLIKGLALWFERGGYDLHSCEDLDLACNVIREVLVDQGISCPDAGDNIIPGKLRRIIMSVRAKA